MKLISLLALAFLTLASTPIPCAITKAPGHVIISWHVLPKKRYHLLSSLSLKNLTNIVQRVDSCQIGLMTVSVPATNRVQFFKVLEQNWYCPPQ